MLQLAGMVLGSDLTPGMRIAKEANTRPKDILTVPAFSGRCASGLHFGQGCYNYISPWYLFTEEKDGSDS